MPTPEELERLDKLVDEYAAKLGEHFDAVQILGSVATEEGTRRLFKGSGNWYARQGMAHEFIKIDEAQELARQIKRASET